LYVDKSTGFIYIWNGASYVASSAGGLKYAGLWDADTNTPTITSGVGSTGEYYVVGTAGTTTIDGESDWQVGDWIIFGGTIWQKIDNSDREGYNLIQEEGVSLPQESTIDFVGAGVSASAGSGKTIVTIPGSIGATVYYMNQSVTQSPYKEFSSIGTTAAEQVVSATVAGGDTATIASFLTPSGVPNTTVIPQGLWQLFLHFNAGSAGQNWIIRPRVYKRDLGGTETLIFTPDPEIVTNMSTTTTMYTCDGVFPTTTLLTTDRIVVKIRLENTTGVSQTANFRTEGSQHYSVATTTLNQAVPTGGVTSVTGTSPIASSGGTTPAISIADAVADGTTKGAASFTASDFNSSSGNISIDYTNGQAASASNKGFLTSTDWTTFNGKQNAITLTTTGTSGAATLVGSTLNVPNYATSASGIFGIANTSGVYTYYATLTLAMAAATSGQTIEMFADVTETGAVTITLKNGVNINGNGHTYTYTNTANNCFIDNGVAVSCSILDLNVTRQAATSTGHIFYITSNNTSIDFSGSFIYYNVVTPGVYSCFQMPTYNGNGIIKNLNAKSTGNAINSINYYGIRFINCIGESTGSGVGIGGHTIIGSTGISVSGYGISTENGGIVYNSVGISTSSTGISGQQIKQCSAISTSGDAINGYSVINCYAKSSSGRAIAGFANLGSYYNCTCETDTNNVTNTNLVIGIFNSSCITNWNNANGHCLSRASTIVNCYLQVANASANCIYYVSALTVKYANNSFVGATTPVNANITQGIVNTQDNQGNILL
jgi:hypothetical protein